MYTVQEIFRTEQLIIIKLSIENMQSLIASTQRATIMTVSLEAVRTLATIGAQSVLTLGVITMSVCVNDCIGWVFVIVKLKF